MGKYTMVMDEKIQFRKLNTLEFLPKSQKIYEMWKADSNKSKEK